jgi:hypothetical protein
MDNFSKAGTTMANGVILKSPSQRLKADRKKIVESFNRVAKITKGLYSGILNSDPDFSKFQQKELEDLIEKESITLFDTLIEGAEEQLSRISKEMAVGMGLNRRIEQDSYIVKRGATAQVAEIDLNEITDVGKDENMVKKISEIIDKQATELSLLNKDEVRYVDEINKQAEKITEERNKIREKMNPKSIKKGIKNEKK